MSNDDKIHAARILVASQLIRAYARNLRDKGDHDDAQRLENMITEEWKQHGEIVITDDALRIPVENDPLRMHLYIDIIARDYVPSFIVPEGYFERGLRQNFAIFRAACESFWIEFRAKMHDIELPPLVATSETIYEFVGDHAWRVGILSYFASKNGQKYKLDE